MLLSLRNALVQVNNHFIIVVSHFQTVLVLINALLRCVAGTRGVH